ncbi:MAG TPA: hypothetical protein VGI93_01800 [Steroidobacteraceae bacterium]|jgi:hypothetical protein
MKFDVYGRFQLEVLLENGRWNVYRRSLGVRRRDDLVIPANLREDEIATYLDDLFHEAAKFGDRVKRVE